MKSLSFGVVAALAGFAVAAPRRDVMEELASLQKRQSGGSIASLVGMINSGAGKVADPAGAAPKRINLANRATSVPNAKTVKMRYGPYKVPNMGKKNVVGEAGSLWNYPDTVVEKPCAECVIVGMNAGLEYPDGKNANIDTNMWLHHMVMFSIGPGRTDATCMNSKGSLPHMLVGSSATGSERMFSSGNERTPAFVPQWSGMSNVGYHMKSTDKLAFIIDLMNENMDDKVVYLTITFDYVTGRPAGFDDMRPVWFDAAQCSTSEVRAPKQNGSFAISAPAWTANFDGEVMGMAGHMHDGGDHLTIDVSGKLVCDSVASYGTTPEYVQKTPMGHKDSATSHISVMSVCMGPTLALKELKKGQVWNLKAYYDYNKNKGMLHDNGGQSTVMGIAIMYVRVKAGQTFGSTSAPKGA